jgi:hypothetical protein
MGDVEITCFKCKKVFVWTAEKQSLYAERQWTQPRRCGPCRDATKRHTKKQVPLEEHGRICKVCEEPWTLSILDQQRQLPFECKTCPKCREKRAKDRALNKARPLTVSTLKEP